MTHFSVYLAAERRLSETTVATYTSETRAFLSFLKGKGRALEAAKADDVSDYLVSRQVANIDARTLAKAASAIRAFFRYLVLEGRVGSNPARLVDAPRVAMRIPRYLETEEIDALLDACDPSEALGIRDRALFELIYSCGLRVTEAVRLTVDRVYLAESAVRVMGKGSRERLVPIGDRAKRQLETYLSQSRPRLAGRSPVGCPVHRPRRQDALPQDRLEDLQEAGTAGGARGQGPLPAALVRDPSPPGRRRPAVGAGAAGPRGHRHDTDLYAREPGGPEEDPRGVSSTRELAEACGPLLAAFTKAEPGEAGQPGRSGGSPKAGRE